MKDDSTFKVIVVVLLCAILVFLMAHFGSKSDNEQIDPRQGCLTADC